MIIYSSSVGKACDSNVGNTIILKVSNPMRILSYFAKKKLIKSNYSLIQEKTDVKKQAVIKEPLNSYPYMDIIVF